MVISQGHLTITGDTEFVTTGEEMLLATSRQKAGMLLNMLHRLGWPPQQRTTQLIQTAVCNKQAEYMVQHREYSQNVATLNGI